jgi:hypothetical protein
MLQVQIVISGQYRENYGSHDWDGIGECPQYWKNKGSHLMVVACNVPLMEAPAVMKEIAERMNGFSWSDESSSCGFDEIKMYPNKMNGMDMGAFDYEFYNDIESYPKEELQAFLNCFGLEPEVKVEIEKEEVYFF